MKSFKEYIKEQTPTAYLANVIKGKPAGRRDKPFGRIPSNSKFQHLPMGIRRILGTNI